MAKESDSSKRVWRDSMAAGSLAVAAVTLAAIVAVWPGGVTGFMHGVAEELDVVAIAILLALIGSVFVFLNRLGFSIGYADEIETVKS